MGAVVTPAADGPGRGFRMLRRVLVAVAALLVLLWQARSGTPTPRLVLLSAVFVVAATIWLHAQYVDGLDGRPWTLPPWATAVLVAGGFALLGAGRAWSPGYPLGVIAIYLGIAFLMTWLRRRTQGPSDDAPLRRRRRRQLARRVAGLVAGGVAALAGLLVWSSAGHAAGVVLLVAGVAFMVMPAFVLLGEWLIRDWTRRSGRFLAVAAATAAAVLGAVAGVAAWRGYGVLLAGQLILVALVVAALADTHVDFVAVMLVAALLGVTARPATTPGNLGTTAHEGALAGRVLVSLGDSYMSGEGASVFYNGTDTGENQCRQAPTAWARQQALLGRFDSMLFLACSGALTQHVLPQAAPPPSGLDPELPRPPTATPQKGTSKTQLDAAVEQLDGIKPDLVVLSIGGNDAGFSGIGGMCLAPGKCDDRHEIWDGDGNFAQLDQQLDGVYDAVAEAFPDSAVVVVPYPDPIYTGPDADCGDLLLTPSEATFVKRFLLGGAAGDSPGAPAHDVIGLNPVLQRQAAAHGFYFAAPMAGALRDERLQLCDPVGDTPGLHFLGLRSIQGVAGQRFHPKNWLHSSLHPNEKGHAALLHAFAGWYEKTLQEQVAGERAPRSADGRTYRLRERAPAAPAPRIEYAAKGCAISGKGGCRAEAGRWVREQVPRTLLSGAGLALLVVVACAAVLGVAGNAWRRKRWTGSPNPFP